MIGGDSQLALDGDPTPDGDLMVIRTITPRRMMVRVDSMPKVMMERAS